MDGDGQMDPNELTQLLDPIIDEDIDFTKGNRFYLEMHMKKCQEYVSKGMLFYH